MDAQISVPGPGAAALIAAGICGYAASASGLPDNILGWLLRGGLLIAVFYLGAIGWKIEKLHRSTA